MIDFIIRFLFVCGVDTFFLSALIFIKFNKYTLNFKDILAFFLLNSMSYYLQSFQYVSVLGGILLYYFVFRVFYHYKNKLILTVFLSFTALATITALTYSPIILAFNLDANLIYNNTISLLVIRMPLFIIEILILILIRRKKK